MGGVSVSKWEYDEGYIGGEYEDENGVLRAYQSVEYKRVFRRSYDLACKYDPYADDADEDLFEDYQDVRIFVRADDVWLIYNEEDEYWEEDPEQGELRVADWRDDGIYVEFEVYRFRGDGSGGDLVWTCNSCATKLMSALYDATGGYQSTLEDAMNFITTYMFLNGWE